MRLDAPAKLTAAATFPFAKFSLDKSNEVMASYTFATTINNTCDINQINNNHKTDTFAIY